MKSKITRRRALAAIGAGAAATITAMVAMAARTTTSTAFDPAAWLREAERHGYDVFLWDGRGDGRLGLFIANPEKPMLDDTKLWRALRQPRADRRANERALREHLLEIGRVQS